MADLAIYTRDGEVLEKMPFEGSVEEVEAAALQFGKTIRADTLSIVDGETGAVRSSGPVDEPKNWFERMGLVRQKW